VVTDGEDGIMSGFNSQLDPLVAFPLVALIFEGVSLQSPRNSHISLGLESRWLSYRSSHQAGIR
jgi:hypothetical protein